MSIFRCGYCDQDKDADIDGCEKNPFESDECVCENCAEELEGIALALESVKRNFFGFGK